MKCGAKIKFTDIEGDEISDNILECQLEEGHKGWHQEKGDYGFGDFPAPYTLRWKVGNGDFVEVECIDE